LNNPSDTNRPYCSTVFESKKSEYDIFNKAPLTIRQKVHEARAGSNARSVTTNGAINLRRIPKDAKDNSKGYFTVDIKASEPNLDVFQTWNEVTGLLEISTPKYAPYTTIGRPCIAVEITAWLPEHAEILELLVESITLDLQVFEDAKIKVIGKSTFSTRSGYV